MCVSDLIMRVKVHWELNLLPSWIWLVLTSFCHVLWLTLLFGRKAMTNLDSILKSRGITLPTNDHIAKAMVLPVVMYRCELDYEEGWALKNWCFQIVVLEKTLGSLLGCKEIQPVNPKGNRSWIFNGRTDTEAETPILRLPDAKMTPWKRLWFWERLKAGGEGGDRGWDGWMASPTRWTWVWASFGSWWWAGKPVVLQSMGLQNQTLLSEWTVTTTMAM